MPIFFKFVLKLKRAKTKYREIEQTICKSLFDLEDDGLDTQN